MMARRDPFVVEAILGGYKWNLYEVLNNDADGFTKKLISSHNTRAEAREAKRQLMKEEPR